jgi:hypothetical protein
MSTGLRLTIDGVIKEIFDLMEKADYDTNQFFEELDKLKESYEGFLSSGVLCHMAPFFLRWV